MPVVNPPQQPACRLIAGPIAVACSIAALALGLPGCDRQSPTANQTAAQHIMIFAPLEMEPIIRAAEAVARKNQEDWRIDLHTGGAQSLAWRIGSGESPDLYISSTVAMAEDLLPKPIRIDPWLNDPLVVIARTDDPNPILRSERALERSTGPVAVGGVGTPLGDYTRLALRYTELWLLVERRTTQRITPDHMIKALRRGEVDLAIVFASDAARGGPDLFITQRLDLPEVARIVYTRASFTDLGIAFADLLGSPESIERARDAGYTPAAMDAEHGG